jgi:acyl-CoA thioesterase FadM
VPESTEPFVHRIRVRYAEIDGQGVVFNAHWLTYFDDACTRFMESLGFGSDFWIKEFDVMLVKAVVEWSGSARFDNWIEVEVAYRNEIIRSALPRVDRRHAGMRRDDHVRRNRGR